MRLLLDENLPATLARALSAAGFDIRLVADVSPGATDEVVLAGAVRDAELVVTADKDFGTLVYQGRHAHLGVVLVRLHPISTHVERIVRVLADRRGELRGAFAVIDARRVRIRRRPGDP